MPSITPNLRLSITNRETNKPFLNWRLGIDGPDDSNMIKLDRAWGDMKIMVDGAMAAVGHAYTAATAAEMTDHDKSYVYVGSETGYTNGNWYYWNEDQSAWVSGGVYNATALQTDDTLTLEGEAADAKATGEMIVINGTSSNGTRINITTTDEDVQLVTYDDISGLMRDVNVSTNWEDGAISSSSGSNTNLSGSNDRIRTVGYIPGNAVQVSVADGYKYCLAAYDATVYQGMWNGSTFVKTAQWRTTSTPINLSLGYDYRIVLSHTTDTDSIDPSDYDAISIFAITDETLSIRGEAADAAATTGAINTAKTAVLANLAPGYSPTGRYAVGDYVINNMVLYKCKTPITSDEAWTAAHWDQVPLGDDVADLKTQIKDRVSHESMNLCDLETVEASKNLWNPSRSTAGGGILANGSFYENPTYCYEKIAVNEGDTLYFYNLLEERGISSSRWLCAYDNDDLPVSASGSNTSINSYIVPSGIKSVTISTGLNNNNNFMVIVNESTPPDNYIPYNEAYQRYVATEGFLKNIDFGVTKVEVPIYEMTETSISWTDGYFSANGTFYTSESYQYSQKIPVSEGDILKPVGDSGSNFRFLCAYNGNSVVAGSGSNTGITEYQVPNTIDGVVVSVAKTYNILKVSNKHLSGTQIKSYPITQRMGRFNWTGDLSNGDSVELLSSNVRFDTVWNFTGHVTTMGKITIGNKSDSDITELLSVDTTNVYYKSPSGDITAPHGLTISGDLTIHIDCDMRVNYLKGVTITSLGESYAIAENIAYSREMYGRPYLASDGAVMTDCAFSWIPRNIDKPIWVFGDSWVSMYDTRWPYYMKEAGYNHCWMLNGFAGEKTKQGLESFENLLTIRKPDYIVWLYGMNDGDGEGAVNTDWKFAYDKLISICTDYKIIPILYTVPNTPTIDNNYKNAIVEASGYRYIDGVAAVGDDGSGNWFTGYEQSSSDHNHTSAKGAKALFIRILTDFPEIAGNGI